MGLLEAVVSLAVFLGLFAAGPESQSAVLVQVREDAPARGPVPVLEAWDGLFKGMPGDRAVRLETLVLERDVFTLRLGPGDLHLFGDLGGLPAAAVYLGRGTLTLEPATEGERRHLARKSGQANLRTLEEEFDSALLWFDDGTARQILELGPVEERPAPARATELVKRWRTERRVGLGVDVELALVRSLVNDEGLTGGPFFAYLEGGRRKGFLVASNPAGVLDDEESALVAGDDGSYWYSSHTAAEVASGAAPDCRPRQPFDAYHYEIDTRIARDGALDAATTVRFGVRAPSVRLVPFELAWGLEVERAVLLGETGETEVRFLRRRVRGPAGDGSWVVLVLPAALEQGARATVRWEYAGNDILVAEGAGIFSVRSRTDWYPKLGGFQDRATYDLRFEAPEGLDLVSVGERVDSDGTEGAKVSRWRAADPITVAGFNFGELRRFGRHEENTDTEIEVFAATGTPDFIEEINRLLQDSWTPSNRDLQEVAANGAQVIMAPTGPTDVSVSPTALGESATVDAVNTVRLLSHFFGPLPYRRLAVTQQVEWSFGQAWPTLVYLPYLSALGRMMAWEMGIPGYSGFADEVAYHEIAHQWWGHRVGWESYRDQWLSEGFAEFSTALLREATEGWQAYDDFWEKRRLAIVEASGGMEPWRAGSIDLGFRAEGPDAVGAYSALIYSKGAYVLHMLRMAMRDGAGSGADARFFAMLREFVEGFDGGAAATSDFRRVAERYIVPELDYRRDGTLGWFFDQWVHGQEIPSYVSEVKVEKTGGGAYRLHGTLRQQGVSKSFVAMVPLYAQMGKGRFALLARVPFRGEMEVPVDMTVKLPKKPKAVRLNALHDILAR